MSKSKNKTKDIKAEIRSGLTVSCDIYTDDGNEVGEFVFICSFCHFDYFNFSDDGKTLYCGKCHAKVGYLLEHEWKRPPDSPGRKVLGFYYENIEYVWTCGCGHDLHHLHERLTHTQCEKCQSKTSRRKDVAIVSMTDRISWNV